MNKIVKGYKAFNKGLTCLDFQFELGKDFIKEGKLELCKNGFHFCKNLSDVYSYYAFDTENTVVCEIEAFGDVIDEEDGDKSVTNGIRLLRILNAEQASNNNGNKNIGHSNTGHRNTGHSNTGDSNTGDSNTGHSNTGHSNTGHRNTGDWNTSNFNTGSFNTEEVLEVLVFNKMCSKKEWDNANKPYCLYFKVNEWVDFEDMTKEEKQEYNTSKYTGGFMRNMDYKKAFTESMKKATKEEIEQVKKLPNFDADVFYKISGFKIK